MKKSIYFKGVAVRYLCNFTEHLANLVLRRRVPNTLIYEKKLKYGEDKQETVVTFRPSNAEGKKKPLFLYVHGGGWVSGLVSMRNTYVMEYAKIGFFAASIGYAYAPREIFPFQIRECFKAIDWLYDHAEQYNIDMNNVLIAGESAGAYFIAQIAACCADHKLYDILGIEFKHKEEFKANAAIINCGAVNIDRLSDPEFPASKFPNMKLMCSAYLGLPYKELREWLKTEEGAYASPKITSGFPPSMVITAKHDPLRHEGEEIKKELAAAGVIYGEFLAEGIISLHAWSMATIVKKGRECLHATLDFVLPYFPNYFDKTKTKSMEHCKL